MILSAICDDNKVFLDTITTMVDKLMQEASIEHEIHKFLHGETFLTQHRSTPFDVVFLDIAMPDMNGFEVAKEIRRISERTYIIFVTTESSLVYDSFDFQPFYFIPKVSMEHTKSRIARAVGKLAKHISANQPIRFDLPYGNTEFIFPDDIIIINSIKNYVNIVTSDGRTINIRSNTEETAKKLPAQLFARVHNRYIVNMKHIKWVDYPNALVYLSNGSAAKISRGYKKIFQDEYNNFLRNFR